MESEGFSNMILNLFGVRLLSSTPCCRPRLSSWFRRRSWTISIWPEYNTTHIVHWQNWYHITKYSQIQMEGIVNGHSNKIIDHSVFEENMTYPHRVKPHRVTDHWGWTFVHSSPVCTPSSAWGRSSPASATCHASSDFESGVIRKIS